MDLQTINRARNLALETLVSRQTGDRRLREAGRRRPHDGRGQEVKAMRKAVNGTMRHCPAQAARYLQLENKLRAARDYGSRWCSRWRSSHPRGGHP